MEVFEVNDVYEAVTLAEHFHKTGKYDWFRGQKRDWPLKSSFVRLDEQKQKDAQEKLKRFYLWAQKMPSMEYILTNADSMMAVAQHYGIPTNLIDFTIDPKIAGFFATDGKDDDGLSCILCLSLSDFDDFWAMMPPCFFKPRVFEIDVSNLWRLQAQKGRFLDCPYADIESLYDFDRIFFKGNKKFSVISKNSIYPDRKSQLEIILDQYFENERRIEIDKTFMTIARKVEMPYEYCIPESLVNGKLPPIHASWDDNNIKSWLTSPSEHFSSVLSDITVSFPLHPNDEPLHVIKHVSNLVLEKIESVPQCRKKLITWSFPIDEYVKKECAEGGTIKSKRLTNLLLSGPRSMSRSNQANGNEKEVIVANLGWLINLLWDGLRVLPYSNADVAEGIGVLAGIITGWIQDEKKSYSSICSQCINDDVFEIDFGTFDGGGGRSFVSTQGLIESIRKDIELENEYLQWQDRPNNQRFKGLSTKELQYMRMDTLFAAIWSPSHTFDFQKLASLWAKQIAPTQILKYLNNNAIIYSPARLETLGRP
jgi:hypothetical protein